MYKRLISNKLLKATIQNSLYPSCKRKLTIGFIGGGNMAKALSKGIVHKGLVSYNNIHVSEPIEEAVQFWRENKAICHKENGRVAEQADVIILAVKPHILPVAVNDIHKTVKDVEKTKNKLYISIIAGLTSTALESYLSGIKGVRVVRTMPNTPMMLGEGCTLFCQGRTSTPEDLKLVYTLMSSCGMCTLIPESMLNAAGSVTGCGPAFVYVIIEALSDAVVKVGVPRNLATAFSAKTVLGAARMVLETGKHTGMLKDEVCSPGGTTITGIHAMESGRVRATLMDAIVTATRRGEELGKMYGNK